MLASLLTITALAAAPDTTPRPQGVDYRIEARLDETTDVLRGRARLRYTNRAAVALDTLWLHQHLNAFRPNSAWARREAQFGERRFQDLGPAEHAYERFTRVEVGGQPVRPVYPGAPDSTVVGIPLPAPLRPGDSVTVLMDWDARLSTTPRRQGRRGRHYDFAQWYPRIAVFENGRWQTQPLLPQGEFYGEFASYDVTLDVAADQVLGSTGVPVEGDPGWQGAASPGTGEIRYRRDAYPARPAAALGLLPGTAEAGRKRVRWRAEQVHHFGWSADPEFIYEQGRVPRIGGTTPGDIPVHVLYLPGDTAWDQGVAVRRTEEALIWLQRLMGPYLWPQITNLHRIESGGTEFPMLIMNGSASEGLIAHELAHQYLHGMLANNEWRDGWLDEGLASFVTNWYHEERGQTDVWEGSLRGIQALERAGATQPVATPSADFRDPATYSRMTYTKAALVFRMLRDLVGPDTMRLVLRRYFEQNAPGHVNEADLRRAVNETTGQSYDWFFDQWLHTTHRLDYGLGTVRTERLRDGRWRTRADVIRTGNAWMPVTLQIGGERRTLRSRERVQRVEVITRTRPAEAVLDPGAVLLDFDPSNNRRAL